MTVSRHSERNSEDTPLLRAVSAPDEGTGSLLTLSRQSSKAHAQLSPLRGLSIVLALGVLIFLQLSNISLLTTIQSPIADELNAHSQVSWFASVYLIAMSSVTPLAGRLCQIFLPQSYILVSSIIFAAGIFATSIAPTLPWFLFGRALTGIGAAGNFPVGIIVIVNLTSVKRRGLFMGLLNTGYTVGVALGAVIAGALEPAVGWRAVFTLQIPLALVAGIAMFFAMPEARHSANEMPSQKSLSEKLSTVDYLGVATLVPFIVTLLLGLASPLGIEPVPIIISFLFFIAFLYTELRLASAPTIPISLLGSRAMFFTCLATLLLMVSRWSVLFYSPVYAIAVRSWEPARAGSILLATNGGFAIGGLLAGWLHIRKAGSFYFSCLTTFVFFALFLYLLAQESSSSSPIPLFLLAAAGNGFMTGAAMNYTIIHLLHLTDPATHFVATSLIATFRGFAGSFGSSLSGGFFARVLRKGLKQRFADHGLHNKEQLIGRLLGSPRLVSELTSPEREIAIQSYSDAVKALFVAGSILAVIAAFFQAAAGWREWDKERDEYAYERDFNAQDVQSDSNENAIMSDSEDE